MAKRNEKRGKLAGLIRFFSMYKREKIGIVGLIVLLSLTILSVAEPLYYHKDPNARVHAALSAPEWMKYFDPNYFPDKIYITTDFSSSQEVSELISARKIFIVKDYGTNFEVSDVIWTGDTGAPGSENGAIYFEIKDIGSKPLDRGKPYAKILIGTMIKWEYNLQPHDIDFIFYVRGEPLYELDKLATQGYDAQFLQVYVNLYLENMSREMYPAELYQYFVSKGVIGISQADITEDGYGLFEGGASILTTWSQRKPNIRTDILTALFQKGNVIVFKIALTFRVVNENYRLDNAGVRFYIDKIFVKTYGYYYGIMGTDGYGRDLFALIFDGLKISLLVGIIATFGSIFIGGIVGIVSGYYGGKIDEILMRIVDFLMVMPGLPLLIVLAYIFHSMGVSAFWAIIFVLIIFGWAGMSRVIRSQVLAVKSALYIEAAKAVNASDIWIMRKHIFMSVLPLIMMYMMTGVVGNILAEAGLTFLGVLVPTWNSIGKILNEASVGSIQQAPGGTSPGAFGGIAWWWVFFPGLILMLLGMAFYMVAEAITRIQSPRRAY